MNTIAIFDFGKSEQLRILLGCDNAREKLKIALIHYIDNINQFKDKFISKT
jgi:hypothetical protein